VASFQRVAGRLGDTRGRFAAAPYRGSCRVGSGKTVFMRRIIEEAALLGSSCENHRECGHWPII
jgi:hypothetical protein